MHVKEKQFKNRHEEKCNCQLFLNKKVYIPIFELIFFDLFGWDGVLFPIPFRYAVRLNVC